MSSSQLDDRYEREQAEAVAAALGISIDELDELDWTIESHESEDGVVYGHNVYFGDSSDPVILDKISGAREHGWVRIGPLPE